LYHLGVYVRIGRGYRIDLGSGPGAFVHSSEQTRDVIVPAEAGHGFALPNAGSVDDAKIDRAVADLHADFKRQSGRLQQAQFDRLVLRRNFSPPEMVALTAKLAALGVAADWSASGANGNGAAGAIGDPGGAYQAPDDGRIKQRSPYALLTQREEVELGRRVRLALQVQDELDASKLTSVEEKEIIRRGRSARNRMILANLRLIRFVVQNVRRPIRSLDPWDGIVNLSCRGMLFVSVARQLGSGNSYARLLCCPLSSETGRNS
jgi:hypothetical protein